MPLAVAPITRIMRLQLITALLLVLASPILRGDELPYAIDQISNDVLPFFQVWSDDAAVSSLESARAAFAAGAFKHPKSLMLGYSRSSVWVHVVVTNLHEPDPAHTIQLWDTAAYVLEIFTIDPVTASVTATILKNPAGHPSGTLQTVLPTASLTLPQGGSREIYLHFRSQFSIDASLQIKPQRLPNNALMGHLAVITLHSGVTGALILYNLFVFFVLRYRFYLHYLLFASSLTFYVALVSGTGALLLNDVWPEAMIWAPVLRNLPLVFSILFTRSLLRTAEQLPRLDRVLKGFLVGVVVLFPMAASPWAPLSVFLSDLWLVILAVTFMLTGYLTARQGQRAGMFYLLSWSAITVSVVITALLKNSVIPLNFFTRYSMLFGQMTEMVLIALGLADHISTLISEKRAAEVRAEEGDKNRTLVRVICHDLVNPLNVVIACSALHEQDKEGRFPRDQLWRKVGDAARHQFAIIEHVREMIALISGKKLLVLGCVDLGSILREVPSLFEEQSRTKGVTLVIDLPDQPLEVTADKRSLLYSVVGNLVSNAIKFSHRGSEVRVEARDEPGGVVLRIIDFGIGLPPELLSRLFDTFQPTSRKGTSGEKGTGFGMPIVKNYLDHFGATIEVSSRPAEYFPVDHGTTLTIRFKRPLHGRMAA